MVIEEQRRINKYYLRADKIGLNADVLRDSNIEEDYVIQKYDHSCMR